MPKICIDAGHGVWIESNFDCGAEGATGTFESDINLAVATKLATSLQRNGFETVMTRTDKEGRFVSVGAELMRRCQIANDSNADLFISIHCNSADSASAHGTEVLCIGGGQGLTIAEKVQRNVVDALGTVDRGIKSGRELSVIKNTKMPAILVELAFVSNADEERMLNTDSIQTACAEAITNAVCDFYGQEYTMTTNVNSVATEPIGVAEAIQKLVDVGIINTPTYWEQNAIEGKYCKGEYVALLLQRLASKV